MILSNDVLTDTLIKYPAIISRQLLHKHKETHDYICETYTNTSTTKFTEKLYQHLKEQRPKCLKCNNLVTFNSFDLGYRKYCSHKCTRTISENIKIRKSVNRNNTSYKYKMYKWPSGKETLFQGYENFCIDFLLKTYTEDDILNTRQNMPIFEYSLNGKLHRYYPDIFVKSSNTIYEVKSNWTYFLTENILLHKQTAVINAGYKFKCLIFNKKGQLL